MLVFHLVVLFLLIIGFLIAKSTRPIPTSLSSFEVKKRLAQETSYTQRDRLIYRDNAQWLIDAVSYILLLLFIGYVGALYSWLLAIVSGFVLLSLTPLLSSILGLNRISSKMYGGLEKNILKLASHIPQILIEKSTSPDTRIDSRDELEHVIKQSNSLMTDDERKHVLSALSFNHFVVDDSMTAMKNLSTIEDNELLGPLVLDDLHRTGHGIIPVVSHEQNQIEGLLYVSNLLKVGKKTTSVQDEMDERVETIQEGATLEDALRQMTADHLTILVVLNGAREQIGIITINDCLRKLTGWNL